jgi:hypothetical protein
MHSSNSSKLLYLEYDSLAFAPFINNVARMNRSPWRVLYNTGLRHQQLYRVGSGFPISLNPQPNERRP